MYLMIQGDEEVGIIAILIHSADKKQTINNWVRTEKVATQKALFRNREFFFNRIEQFFIVFWINQPISL